MSDEAAPPPPIAELAREPAAVPLAYGYLRTAPAASQVRRVVESEWHRARGYDCAGMPKPISRCLRVEE
ncbi:MAG TPA: hypothetical protein VF625_11830 [Longimicrobium sp.]|jgi:hypothetical protein